jgi:malate/lactate dehydrogenase
MQLGEVALSLPSIVDRQGIARILPVALGRAERRALEGSSEAVRGHIASLSQTIPISCHTAKQSRDVSHQKGPLR